MQDTTYMSFTPNELARRLNKRYSTLYKTMERLNISCDKNEPLNDNALMLLVSQEAKPHHLKSQETVQAAEKLLKELTGMKQDIPPHTYTADNQADNAPIGSEEDIDLYIRNEEDKEDKEEWINTIYTDETEIDAYKEDEVIETNEDNPSPASDKATDKKTKLTTSKVMRFVFVAGLIALQAWIYAGLSERFMSHQGHHFPKVLMFLAGLLIESAGIMIAADMKIGPDEEKYVGGSKQAVNKSKQLRAAWLWIFFFFQVGIDASYVDLFSYQTNIEFVSKALITISIPGGILAYSHLYLNDKDNNA
jgi:hypothetical protein